MKNSTKLSFAILASVTLSACQATENSASNDAPNLAAHDSNLKITRIIANDVPIDVDLTYDGELLFGGLPCNNLHASFEITAQAIKISDTGTTRQLCSEDIMVQEEEVLRVLSEQGPFIKTNESAWAFGVETDQIILTLEQDQE